MKRPIKKQTNHTWEILEYGTFLDMATRGGMSNISVLSILSSFIAASSALLAQLRNFSLTLLINQAENQKGQLASMIVDYNITKKNVSIKKVGEYRNKLLHNVMLYSFEGLVEFSALH